MRGPDSKLEYGVTHSPEGENCSLSRFWFPLCHRGTRRRKLFIISLFPLCHRGTRRRKLFIISLFPLCHRGTRRRKLLIISLLTPLCLHLHLRLSRSLYHRWATTVDSITIFLHSLRFSAFSSMLFHSRPVHSMMLSSHRFLCLPLRLLCTVPCRIVLASLDGLVTCPYHFSWRLFTLPSGDMLNNILLLTLVCCRTQDQQKISTKQLEFCGHGDACNTCA